MRLRQNKEQETVDTPNWRITYYPKGSEHRWNNSIQSLIVVCRVQLIWHEREIELLHREHLFIMRIWEGTIFNTLIKQQCGGQYALAKYSWRLEIVTDSWVAVRWAEPTTHDTGTWTQESASVVRILANWQPKTASLPVIEVLNIHIYIQ